MERVETSSHLASKMLPQLLTQPQDLPLSTKMRMTQFQGLQELTSSQRASRLKAVSQRTKAKVKTKKTEGVFTKTRAPMAMEVATRLLEWMVLLPPRAMKVVPRAE